MKYLGFTIFLCLILFLLINKIANNFEEEMLFNFAHSNSTPTNERVTEYLEGITNNSLVLHPKTHSELVNDLTNKKFISNNLDEYLHFEKSSFFSHFNNSIMGYAFRRGWYDTKINEVILIDSINLHVPVFPISLNNVPNKQITNKNEKRNYYLFVDSKNHLYLSSLPNENDFSYSECY